MARIFGLQTLLVILFVLGVHGDNSIAEQENEAREVFAEADEIVNQIFGVIELMLEALKRGDAEGMNEFRRYSHEMLSLQNEIFEVVREGIKGLSYHRFEDEMLKRMVEITQDGSYTVLSNTEQIIYRKMISDLRKLPTPGEGCASFARCKDEYEKVSDEVRQTFQKYMELYFKIADAHDISPNEYYYLKFEDETIHEQLKNAITLLEPLFFELYAYVRNQIYGNVSAAAHTPLHLDHLIVLLEDQRIVERIMPFPRLVVENPKLQEDLHELVHSIDDFYQDMGFPPLPGEFFENVHPLNQGHINCDGLVFPLNGTGTLVACENSSFLNFLKMHETLLDVQNIHAAADLPHILKVNDLSGYKNALKKVIELTVNTNKYIERTHYWTQYPEDPNYAMNVLFRQAIDVIFGSFIAYVQEEFTLGILRGDTPLENYYCQYWNLMYDNIGIQPVVLPGKDEVDYINKQYFVNLVTHEQLSSKFFSHILGYQLYKGLCDISEDLSNSNFLHECDFSVSFKAGDDIYNMLSKGRSQKWQDIVEPVIGSRSLSADPLIHYFQPLFEWLLTYNVENSVPKEWKLESGVYKNSCKNP